ncbi:hypothetical protein ACFE04_024058 [Oxalis oulophora]
MDRIPDTIEVARNEHVVDETKSSGSGTTKTNDPSEKTSTEEKEQVVETESDGSGSKKNDPSKETSGLGSGVALGQKGTNVSEMNSDVAALSVETEKVFEMGLVETSGYEEKHDEKKMDSAIGIGSCSSNASSTHTLSLGSSHFSQNEIETIDMIKNLPLILYLYNSQDTTLEYNGVGYPLFNDEKLDLDEMKDAKTLVSDFPSRRDMATQMSREHSTNSSPGERSSSLAIRPVVESQNDHPAAMEIKEVQVDKRATITSWSKRHGHKTSKKRQPEFFQNPTGTRASSWDITNTTVSLSR